MPTFSTPNRWRRLPWSTCQWLPSLAASLGTAYKLPVGSAAGWRNVHHYLPGRLRDPSLLLSRYVQYSCRDARRCDICNSKSSPKMAVNAVFIAVYFVWLRCGWWCFIPFSPVVCLSAYNNSLCFSRPPANGLCFSTVFFFYTVQLPYHHGSITRGNKYKILNHRLRYDLLMLYFSARIDNIWNSLPNHVVDVTTVNLFKSRLDRFWVNQDVIYHFTADLTGIGDRSESEICETSSP